MSSIQPQKSCLCGRKSCLRYSKTSVISLASTLPTFSKTMNFLGHTHIENEIRSRNSEKADASQSLKHSELQQVCHCNGSNAGLNQVRGCIPQSEHMGKQSTSEVPESKPLPCLRMALARQKKQKFDQQKQQQAAEMFILDAHKKRLTEQVAVPGTAIQPKALRAPSG